MNGGLPGGPGVENLPSNAGDMVRSLVTKLRPHAMGQLSPCTASEAHALELESPPDAAKTQHSHTHAQVRGAAWSPISPREP